MPLTIRDSRALRLWSLALLGAFAVHWGRYLLSYGTDAGVGYQGHTFLTELVPSVVILATFVATVSVLRALDSPVSRRPGRFSREALALTLGVLAIYSVQEVSEGMLASGHAGGALALLADGGWVALPLALVTGTFLGLVERLLLRSEPRMSDLLLRGRDRPPARRARAQRRRRPALVLRAASSRALARGWAPRPPPPLPSA